MLRNWNKQFPGSRKWNGRGIWAYCLIWESSYKLDVKMYITKSKNFCSSMWRVCKGQFFLHPQALPAPLLQQFITLSSSLISSHSVFNTLDSFPYSKSCITHRSSCLNQVHDHQMINNSECPLFFFTSVNRWCHSHRQHPSHTHLWTLRWKSFA